MSVANLSAHERFIHLEDALEEIERLRAPFRAVDSLDWDYLLNHAIGHGGRDQFWRAVLTEMRATLRDK